MSKIWTEEEIRNMIQTDDRVLYRALNRLYQCQTEDEQRQCRTTHRNGVGFNGVDGKFMTSICKFMITRGYLTDKQKYCARKKIVKYTKQLTALANE